MKKRITLLLVHCNNQSRTIYGNNFILDNHRKPKISKKEKMSSIRKIYTSQEKDSNIHKVTLKQAMNQNVQQSKKYYDIRTITPSESLSNPSQQTRASSLESNHRHVLSKPETENKISAYRKNRCGASLINNSNVTQYSSRSADRKRGKSPAEYSLNSEKYKEK